MVFNGGEKPFNIGLECICEPEQELHEQRYQGCHPKSRGQTKSQKSEEIGINLEK